MFGLMLMEIDNLYVLKQDSGYGVDLHKDFKEEICVVFKVDELRAEIVMKDAEHIKSKKNLVVIKEEPIMTRLGMK